MRGVICLFGPQNAFVRYFIYRLFHFSKGTKTDTVNSSADDTPKNLMENTAFTIYLESIKNIIKGYLSILQLVYGVEVNATVRSEGMFL